jgi:hypothetical protein
VSISCWIFAIGKVWGISSGTTIYLVKSPTHFFLLRSDGPANDRSDSDDGMTRS